MKNRRKKRTALTKKFVESATKSGRHYDAGRGAGLFLKITQTGAKSWGQRLRIKNKNRELGLGSYPDTNLEQARKIAYQNQEHARADMSLEQIRQHKPKQAEKFAIPKKVNSGVPLFYDAMREVYKLELPNIHNAKNRKQWMRDFEIHAGSLFGLAINEIEPRTLASVLLPIWIAKPVVAKRIRRRTVKIFNWGASMGYFDRIKPAGPVLDALLPKQNHKEKHHSAMPHDKVSKALEAVNATQAYPIVKTAFEFLALTAVRSGRSKLGP